MAPYWLSNSRNSKKGNSLKLGVPSSNVPIISTFGGHIESTRLSQIGRPLSEFQRRQHSSPESTQGRRPRSRVDRKCDRNSSAFLILHRLDLGIRTLALASAASAAFSVALTPEEQSGFHIRQLWREASPIESDPVKEIPVSVPLNRDVCGWYYADRYGAILVLSCFAIGIILNVSLSQFFSRSALAWMVSRRYQPVLLACGWSDRSIGVCPGIGGRPKRMQREHLLTPA